MIITARMLRDARLYVRKHAGIISSGSPEDYLIDALHRAAWSLEEIRKYDKNFQLIAKDSGL